MKNERIAVQKLEKEYLLSIDCKFNFCTDWLIINLLIVFLKSNELDLWLPNIIPEFYPISLMIITGHFIMAIHYDSSNFHCE